ncbi:M14 family metallopeptidase [Acetohalobium arabaticum]|uniref:Peptidase M14 carboxypeptidase A n=1 Tax=Acetohalobium arabaticum (strain ATCC 49924 / DSM 5501 / Z-7288) TaxID=574087 RepID=D9QR58_ACEAZ|nr:M14 family metallocarboxypeptidase [Acetohalobium arabaticum]ADL12999.1 peptidase M14 carboxypeptidase A [Acetohalobium arabaticum DSM 5501]
MKTKLISILLLICCLFFNLTGCHDNQNNSNSKIKQEDSPIITAVSDYNYSQMRKQMNQLEDKYESIKVSTIGKSLAKRNLYLLTLGSGKKKIGVIGGVHGREGITSLLTLKLAEDYAKHLKQSQEIEGYNLEELLDKVTFCFIPMLNPDGIEIATHGIKNEVKDRNFYLKANEGSSGFKRWKANGRGVDLNKQFPADWNQVKSKNSPHFKSYKGPKPESEPESQALADLTRSKKFEAVVAFHNSGNIIYWYYNQKGEEYNRDYKLGKLLSKETGYKLVAPEESSTAAAGYKDWFIKEFKLPGFTIEIGEGKTKQPLPSDKLGKYFKENRTTLLELAQNI